MGSGSGPSGYPYNPSVGNPYAPASAERPGTNQDRDNPPASEIWSGKMLADRLADLSQVVTRSEPASQPGLRTPLVAGTRGSLRQAEDFGWPAKLNSQEIQELRTRLNGHVQEALRQADSSARVEPYVLHQMRWDVDQLRRQWRREVGELTPAENLQSRDFLDSLDDAIVALQRGSGNGRSPGR
jgi:hypothetical protein